MRARLHEGERKSPRDRAPERTARGPQLLREPDGSQRPADKCGADAVQAEHVQGVAEGRGGRERRPHAMDETGDQVGQGALESGDGYEKERRLAVENRFVKPEYEHDLARQADRQTELRRELIAAGTGEHDVGRRAAERADKKRGSLVPEHERKADADETKQEQRANPAGHAEHRAHEPRRGRTPNVRAASPLTRPASASRCHSAARVRRRHSAPPPSRRCPSATTRRPRTSR